MVSALDNYKIASRLKNAVFTVFANNLFAELWSRLGDYNANLYSMLSVDGISRMKVCRLSVYCYLA